jgi:hypothetical protein
MLMDLPDIDEFLAGAAYYPCCFDDRSPVNLLGDRFRRFLYADYRVSRDWFYSGFGNQLRGYHVLGIQDLHPEPVFGRGWQDLADEYRGFLSSVKLDWKEPFVSIARLKRRGGYFGDDRSGRAEILFVRFEGVSTYLATFGRRRIAPRCLVYINPGMGIGGNFNPFPDELTHAIRENPAGLPEYILHDDQARIPGELRYLPLLAEYNDIPWEESDGEQPPVWWESPSRRQERGLTLARLRHGESAAHPGA